MENYRNCTTCDAFLGGGCCRDNLELECREGGGYEAWRYKRKHVFADLAKEYVQLIGHRGGYTIRKEMGHFVLTLEEEHDRESMA